MNPRVEPWVLADDAAVWHVLTTRTRPLSATYSRRSLSILDDLDGSARQTLDSAWAINAAARGLRVRTGYRADEHFLIYTACPSRKRRKRSRGGDLMVRPTIPKIPESRLEPAGVCCAVAPITHLHPGAWRPVRTRRCLVCECGVSSRMDTGAPGPVECVRAWQADTAFQGGNEFAYVFASMPSLTPVLRYSVLCLQFQYKYRYTM